MEAGRSKKLLIPPSSKAKKMQVPSGWRGPIISGVLEPHPEGSQSCCGHFSQLPRGQDVQTLGASPNTVRTLTVKQGMQGIPTTLGGIL